MTVAGELEKEWLSGQLGLLWQSGIEHGAI
jgi:hypothetical protein